MTDFESTPDPRQARGKAIAETRTLIRKADDVWLVPSTTAERPTKCAVDTTAGECTCPDFEARALPCKHVFAVQFTLTRETDSDGTMREERSVRVSYSQEWSAYNKAQTHEHERFLPLLRELCDGIPQPPQRMGRPRLPLSEVVFGLGVQTYSTLSGRRAASLIREAATSGHMATAPSYNSLFRYLESPDLTAILKALIEESARPLAAVESDFAIDSTGIGTTTYHRWFDHTWGRERTKQSWVKVHAMVGTTTNVVTAIEATATESADAPPASKAPDPHGRELRHP